MPPKKATGVKPASAPRKAKGHPMAPEVRSGTRFTDQKKREFVVGKQFASGGFGRIFTVSQVGAERRSLALKVEPSSNGPLFTEINVFQRLLKPDTIDEYIRKKKLRRLGVPPLVSTGVFTYNDEKLRYLVLPKYHESLEAVREKRPGGRFSPHEALTVALECVHALDYIQSQNYVHADVKAANILLEKAGDLATAVLVDYGLARNAVSNVEKADKKRAHNGTCIFTSLDAHVGLQPAYRSDLEILAYNIAFWVSGTLPWKANEDFPEKVQTCKEAWRTNPDASLKTFLPSHAATAKLVASLLRAAFGTAYLAKVDYDRVIKLLEEALKGEKPTKRKSVEVEKKAKKGKVVVEDDEEDEDEIVIETESDDEPSPPPKPARRPRRKSPQPSSSSSARGAEILPGLGGPRPVVKKVEKKDTSKKASSRLSIGTKSDAAKLKAKLPGLQNFPRGRVSDVAKRIAAKYKKIGEKASSP